MVVVNVSAVNNVHLHLKHRIFKGAYILVDEKTKISGTISPIEVRIFFVLKSILTEHLEHSDSHNSPPCHSCTPSGPLRPNCGGARSAVMALETHASPPEVTTVPALAFQSPICAPPPGLQHGLDMSLTPYLFELSGLEENSHDSDASVKQSETNVRTFDPPERIATNMLLTRLLAFLHSSPFVTMSTAVHDQA